MIYGSSATSEAKPRRAEGCAQAAPRHGCRRPARGRRGARARSSQRPRATAHATRDPCPAAARTLDARPPSSPAHRAPPAPAARPGRLRRPRVRRGGLARTRRLVLGGAFTGRGVVLRPGPGRLAPFGGGDPRGGAISGRPGHPLACAVHASTRLPACGVPCGMVRSAVAKSQGGGVHRNRRLG
jgi:hypothetical protein